ncbi:MAG TPA: CBS domain-containing protein [Pyrodictium sp.]|nr:CBS domain-containing protein [Pyrodictium sp.]
MNAKLNSDKSFCQHLYTIQSVLKLDIKTLCIPYAHILAPDDSYAVVRRKFLESRLHSLPVVDERSKRCYGIVHRSNLLIISASRTFATAKDLVDPAIEATIDTPFKHAVSLLIAGKGYAVLVNQIKHFECLLGVESLLENLLAANDKFLEQPIKRVMVEDVAYVKRGESVERVWRKLLTSKVSALAVIEDDGRIIGVVSEYDLLARGYARPRFESDNRVGNSPSIETLMSTPPFTVKPGDPLRIAVEWMASKNIGRVYVVDDDDRLLGVVDRLSIAKAWLSSR